MYEDDREIELVIKALEGIERQYDDPLAMAGSEWQLLRTGARR